MMGRAERFEYLDAVHPGQLEVEQHDVRAERRGEGKRGRSVFRLADDREVVLDTEQCAQPLPDYRVVIDDEHPDRAAAIACTRTGGHAVPPARSGAP